MLIFGIDEFKFIPNAMLTVFYILTLTYLLKSSFTDIHRLKVNYKLSGYLILKFTYCIIVNACPYFRKQFVLHYTAIHRGENRIFDTAGETILKLRSIV